VRSQIRMLVCLRVRVSASFVNDPESVLGSVFSRWRCLGDFDHNLSQCLPVDAFCSCLSAEVLNCFT
jgi:hypothetical protein